ncbi:hypothetical protein GCM10009797_20360 [Nocardioides hwasunensis]
MAAHDIRRPRIDVVRRHPRRERHVGGDPGLRGAPGRLGARLIIVESVSQYVAEGLHDLSGVAGYPVTPGQASELLLEVPEPRDGPEAERLVDADHVLVDLGVVRHQPSEAMWVSTCASIAEPWP